MTSSVHVRHRRRKELAVQHRREADASPVFRGVQNLVFGENPQFSQRLCAGAVGPRLITLAALFQTAHGNGAVEQSATLTNHLVEESLSAGNRRQRAHRERACAFTKDSDVIRVPAKSTYVCLHPLQRGYHVHQAIVACVTTVLLGEFVRG